MDDKKLRMIMTILKVVLVVIGVVACFMVILGPNGNAEVDVREEFENSFSLGLAINYTLYIILGGIAVILAFFLIQLITNTKKTALSIAGILAAGVLYLIFKLMGTTDTNESLDLAEKVQQDADVISTTTAGIYTGLFLLAIGGLVWILGPLMGRLRK
ncbi:MAG: hypothetical protein QNK78_05905 [Crocinitomicaceae bacterium]|jgi:hypothetical protein|nr:hypothetical protein [Crocinitomicaceae bacterium]MDC0100238.1 hypothetical protein [Crocinitomicaceae bacterium]MDC1385330.1 hypothetical protein [Crocinitomicaceae bacterium]|tara:strand:+ start:556 stop:1029 length:474 start_codon:yes stop_codon:yes gene_type:complete